MQAQDSMDEVWLAEWVAFGLRELEAYLRRQAAFDEYYQSRLAHETLGRDR